MWPFVDPMPVSWSTLPGEATEASFPFEPTEHGPIASVGGPGVEAPPVDQLIMRPWPNRGYMDLPPQLLDDACLSLLLPPHVVLQFDADASSDLIEQMQALEVDPATTFMAKIFGLLPPSIMGAPPSDVPRASEEEGLPMHFIPTPARLPEKPRHSRRSSVVSGLTQQQTAQARLVQQLQFIDKPSAFSSKVREQYVQRFKTPLGRLTTKLARATGVVGKAKIKLPDADLRELAGEEIGNLA